MTRAVADLAVDGSPWGERSGRPAACGNQEDDMQRTATLCLAIVLMAGCAADDSGGAASGGVNGDEPATSAPAGGGGSGAEPSVPASVGGGSVVDPQPAGQASVSVDGIEVTLDELGATDCTMGGDEFGFSFRTADNALTLGAGGVFTEGSGWAGSLRLIVADPYNEYVVDLSQVDASNLAFSGSSMSYQGPWIRGAGEDAGTGTVSVTCP
jgi:hypothetical protein